MRDTNNLTKGAFCHGREAEQYQGVEKFSMTNDVGRGVEGVGEEGIQWDEEEILCAKVMM